MGVLNRRNRCRAGSPLLRDRRAVCRLLAERGPMAGDDIAAALGWTLSRWWKAFETEGSLFKIEGKGIDLTAKGRREAQTPEGE